MARETRSRDKKLVKPHAAESGDAPTKLKITLSNPGKKRKRSSTSATISSADDVESAAESRPPANTGPAPDHRILGPETRKAITLLIDTMRQSMPPNNPARSILNHALPPSLPEAPEKTLAHMLHDASLTRSELKSALSALATTLLASTTPSPFSETPANAMTLNGEQQAVYDFFRSVHRALESLNPSISQVATFASSAPSSLPIPIAFATPPTQSKAFALQQRMPGSGQHGEWFTSAVEEQRAECLLQSSPSKQRQASPSKKSPVKSERRGSIKEESTGLAKVLESSDNYFGHATPVAVHPTIRQTASSSGSTERTLADSVYQRASQNVEKIKALRAAKRKRLFGSVTHAVDFTSHARQSWQPSFGMTHDSTPASGGWGYISSWNMAYRNGDWKGRQAEHWGGRVGEESFIGERGTGAAIEDAEMGGVDKAEDVSEMLSANERRIRELSDWQAVRVRRGDPNWISKREASVAAEVADTLFKLTARTAPSTLVPAGETAITLASKVIHTSAPRIRGTLDPRRPRAVVDDGTLKLGPLPPARPGSATVIPVGQMPQRYAPSLTQSLRPSTPMQYNGARPLNTPQYPQTQPLSRLSTPLPVTGHGSQSNLNPYPRASVSSTPMRPGQSYPPPPPLGRSANSVATPVVLRAAPLVAASAASVVQQ